MTYAPHTAESLKKLTWGEILALHKGLGLKATRTTATRAHYEQRILAAQPQKAADAAIVPAASTAVTKCSECPFARPLDGNRYVCTGVRSASVHDVVRGHWEVTDDCLWFMESQQAVEAEELVEVIVIEPVEEASPVAATSPAPTPAPTRKELIDRAREVREMLEEILSEFPAAPRYSPAPYIPHSPRLAWDGKCECHQCQSKGTTPQPIKLNRPPAIRAYPHSAPEGETIRWFSPSEGEVLGRTGYRPFFIFNNEICVILQSKASVFVAREFAKPNYLHQVIRQAIEAGKSFDPAAHHKFAVSRGFNKAEMEEIWSGGRNAGCVHQASDGWWWAWSEGLNPARRFAGKEKAVEFLKGNMLSSVSL